MGAMKQIAEYVTRSAVLKKNWTCELTFCQMQGKAGGARYAVNGRSGFVLHL
jgi:hypothetical protein